MNLDATVHFESLFRRCRSDAHEIAVVKNLRVATFGDVAETHQKILCTFELRGVFTVTACPSRASGSCGARWSGWAWRSSRALRSTCGPGDDGHHDSFGFRGRRGVRNDRLCGWLGNFLNDGLSRLRRFRLYYDPIGVDKPGAATRQFDLVPAIDGLEEYEFFIAVQSANNLGPRFRM